MDVTRRVALALACAALDPSLAGILLLDLDPALIYPLARWLKALLMAGPPQVGESGAALPLIQLGPRMAEDTLWQRFKLTDPEHPEFHWEPGRLAGYKRDPGIVVVPNLGQLGLPGSRAVTMLVGADVAHLERSGVRQLWRPRDRWLAALRSDEADTVSAHLLDRFTLRVPARGLQLPWDPDPDLRLLWDLDPELKQVVRDLLRTGSEDRPGPALPALRDAAVAQVLSIVPHGVPGARRYLALGRLARALAALAGDDEVLPGHVDSAAELTGLLRRTGQAMRPEEAPPGGGGDERASGGGQAALGPPNADGKANGRLPVESARTADREFIPELDYRPYPEDTPQPDRDAPKLRLGWQRVLTGPPRGQPVGTQRALNGSDIAVVATLLNAARFQRVRCSLRGMHYLRLHRLHLEKQDLLSYRRAPLPGQLLVLLLDHTVAGDPDWDWYEPLEEYLGWAYANRALVGVVEVGAMPGNPGADLEPGELRATQFQSRGVLDPRVLDALEPRPGRATPLAHGLSMAWELLRRSTQQGGPAVTEAVLVVVTDGRANVPLADSKAGTAPSNVGLKGFEDALGEARKIRELGRSRNRVHSVVIDPGWQANSRLAVKLARELGAALKHATPTMPEDGADPGPSWPEPAGGGRDG